MTLSLDGNHQFVIADGHTGTSLVFSDGLGMNMKMAWDEDTVHVAAQAMAAAGDRGIPITVPPSDTATVAALALLFHGYGTGEPYEASKGWIAASGLQCDENDPKWEVVRRYLWP